VHGLAGFFARPGTSFVRTETRRETWNKEIDPISQQGSLILVGGVFLAAQIAPGLFTWFQPELNWPLFVVGAGFVLLVIGLLANEPGMAVPACIVGGVGGLLYWQNLTKRWETWSYAWALIPGFVGVGVTILVSLVLFVVFGTIMGGQFTGFVWPSILIAAGVILLIGNLLRGR
jgi:protein-S-isoprenylcysteine O-methyltransferase Ste14